MKLRPCNSLGTRRRQLLTGLWAKTFMAFSGFASKSRYFSGEAGIRVPECTRFFSVVGRGTEGLGDLEVHTASALGRCKLTKKAIQAVVVGVVVFVGHHGSGSN